MVFFDDLKWRQVVAEASEGLAQHFADTSVRAYVGFDPTADSLHVGSLLPVMMLARLQRAGHAPIAIVGGGTGMIGDPSGKTIERQLLTRQQIDENCAGIRAQLERFLDFETTSNPAILVNNADWLAPLTVLDFLRDVGKHFTVNYMLAKESVRRRLESDTGISFTEFSYMLLQAYDYLVLAERYQCSLQMGGSDQWGNIVAGIELIRRVTGKRTHGLVFPLITTASGVKFGKTETGTIWLDPQRTSPFKFFQFWFQTDDRDAITYVKQFTLLDRDEIDELKVTHDGNPEQRSAQYRLACELTRLVHGEQALARADSASKMLFGASVLGLTAHEVEDVFGDVPSTRLPKSRFEGRGLAIVDVAAEIGLLSSKNEARRLIEGGGVYVNNTRVADVRMNVTVDLAIEGRFIILRKGSRQYHLIEVVSD